MRYRTIILLLTACAIALTAACSDDPAKPTEDDDGIDWPPVTDRDEAIETIVLAWNNSKNPESITRYGDILHSMFFFKLDDVDVDPHAGPILTRSEDIQSTQWIFDNQTILELLITETGSWVPMPEVEGVPCDNCWMTTRLYFIRAQFGDELTIHQSPPERAAATFIVAPDESDPSKWAVRAIYDLGIGG